MHRLISIQCYISLCVLVSSFNSDWCMDCLGLSLSSLSSLHGVIVKSLDILISPANISLRLHVVWTVTSCIISSLSDG